MSPRLTVVSWSLALATLAALAPAAAPLPAQYRNSFGAFVARDDALPGGSVVLGGGSLTSYTGPIGLRLSGAMHTTLTSRTRDGGDIYRLGLGAWTADADLVVAPLRWSRTLTSIFGGFSPYAFVGIGGHGVNLRGREDTSFATWSYGAGFDHTLVGALGVQADMRYRLPLHKQAEPVFPPPDNRHWEYRAGITIGFGSHARSRRPPDRHRERYGERTESSAPASPPRSSAADAADYPSSATTSAVTVVSPGSAGAPRSGAAAGATTAQRLIGAGEGYLGAPYRYGGAAADGFDCSGFVQVVFASEGIGLPRTARRMIEVGEPVSASTRALRPGDLVFFAHDGQTVDHVAIYAGNGRILHATASGGGVRYDDLGDGERGRWFTDHLVAARRPIDGPLSYRAASDAVTDDTEFDPPDRAPAPAKRER